MSPSSTSSSDTGSSPWAFLWRAVRFALPLLVVVLSLEALLWRSGETYSVASVAALQQDSEELGYQRGLLSQDQWLYKRSRLRVIDAPYLIVLGSSRVLQIRADMMPGLRGPMYNAGGACRSVADVERFADEIGAGSLPLPRCVLLGIDPWWVTRRADASGDRRERPAATESIYRPLEHVGAIRALVGASASTWTAVTSAAGETSPDGVPGRIGVGALRSGGGYRHDGSYRYPSALFEDFLDDPVFRDRDTEVARKIRIGRQLYPADASPDRNAVSRFAAAVRRMSARGIEVVVYIPPLAGVTTRSLSSDERFISWWPWFRDDLGDELRERGVTFIAVGGPDDLGADDLHMIDGHHPSEVLNLRVLARLAQGAPETVLGELDVDALQTWASAARAFPLALEPPTR